MASGFDGITNQAKVAFQRTFDAVMQSKPVPVGDALTRKLYGAWNGMVGNDGFDETNGKGSIVLSESKPRDGSNDRVKGDKSRVGLDAQHL